MALLSALSSLSCAAFAPIFFPVEGRHLHFDNSVPWPSSLSAGASVSWGEFWAWAVLLLSVSVPVGSAFVSWILPLALIFLSLHNSISQGPRLPARYLELNILLLSHLACLQLGEVFPVAPPDFATFLSSSNSCLKSL